MSANMPNTSNINKWRNVVIALVAIILSVTLVFSLQNTANSESLEAQAQNSTPLEIALVNGKPSLVEFYANWCTSCQAMAGDLAQLKGIYGNEVNFVMLNVDNTKWLPEVLRYEVDGIPHFIFLDEGGRALGSTIGEQPLSIFQGNLQALINHQTLPFANSQGMTSQLNGAILTPSGNDDQPRDHG
ncbi:MAG: thioredoxin family protein [Cyanobacterium sp. T60_A2020_053]|nr:thioredoxin family protein [Cyanobacterium sp. T60_A2020_053]